MKMCQYANIFGEPGKGAHKYRIFNIAIVDLVLTLIVCLYISTKTSLNIGVIILTALILSVFIHKFFCVKSTLTNYLWPN
jgi:hypothetical protein